MLYKKTSLLSVSVSVSVSLPPLERKKWRMRSRAVPSGRPSGTDGTDHPYRMTIDDRYRKVVQKKLHLQKLVLAQTIFHLIKAVEVVLRAIKGEDIPNLTIAACVSGGAAILSGTMGLRQTSSKILQIFLFMTCVTLVLAFIPLLSGQLYLKISGSLQNTENFQLLIFNGLEVAQEIIGVVVQIFEVLSGLSLLHLLSRKRT